jgi:hypothetical protein
MQQQYIHVPLAGSHSIRVLRLEPAPLQTSPLRCSLAEVSLDPSPEYWALSYSWEAQSPFCPVECGGGILHITPNCMAALRQLRHSHEERTLWIDSICIDQTSLEERSHQVALMGEIYKRAKQVIAWLGEGDSSTEQAIRRLSDIGKIGTDKDKEHVQSTLHLMFGLGVKDASGDPIGPLFKRSWFHRMWTIQEATLALIENVIIYCGDEVLPWTYLVIAVGFLKASGYKWGQWAEAMQLQMHISDLLVDRRFSGVHNILKSRPGNINSYQGILQILTSAREKGSTEPKDKIFALFGVLTELGIDLPPPDYKKSLEQVYTEAVVACINHDRNLHVLFEVSSDHRRLGLPSWVPDWSDVGWKSQDLRKAVIRDRFGASGSADPRWSFSSDQRCLLLSGKVVDSINHRTASLEVDVEISSGFLQMASGQLRMTDLMRSLNSGFDVLRSWVNVSSRHEQYPTGETVKMALQRTLVTDETLQNDTPRTEEAFDAWHQIMTATDVGSLATAVRRTQPSSPSSLKHNGTSIKALMERTSGELRPFLALTMGPASGFHFAVLKHSRRKCFFTTENGYFGTASDQILPNDKIAILAGLEMPVILREVEQSYHLITHAYVHGLMYGEAWPENATEVMEITLV